jgi:hypothetical protein
MKRFDRCSCHRIYFAQHIYKNWARNPRNNGYAGISTKHAAGRDRLKRTAEVLNGRGTAVESSEERDELKKLIDVVPGAAGIMIPSSATLKDPAVISLLFQIKEDE